MASYSYQALDPSGHTQKGLIQAETERQVVDLLQAKGLVPLAFERQQSETESHTNDLKTVTQGLFVKRLSNADLCQITQQLSTLLQASLPLDDALKAVIEQSHKNVIKAVLNQVLAHVNEGLALAQALAHHPKSFPAAYIATVAAGEQSGQLDNMLGRVAEFQQNEVERIVSTVVKLFEPLMLLIMGGVVLFIVMAILLPLLSMNQLV